MKIISWNVNGIRSVFRTTFLEWLKSADPDIVCLQETKANHLELSQEYTQIDGYYAFFNSSNIQGLTELTLTFRLKGKPTSKGYLLLWHNENEESITGNDAKPNLLIAKEFN